MERGRPYQVIEGLFSQETTFFQQFEQDCPDRLATVALQLKSNDVNSGNSWLITLYATTQKSE